MLAKARDRTLCLVAAALLLAVGGPQPQADVPDARPDFFFVRVDVEVLDVEVVVTGRDGERVRGLGPEDFRVEIDGEPVAIDYFREVHDRRTVRSARLSAGGALAETAPSADEEGVNFLVFVDKSTSFPTEVWRTLEQLEKQLPELRGSDRMTIVSFDGREIRRHGEWTSERRRIVGQLAAVLSERATGAVYVTELRQLDWVASSAPSPASVEEQIVRVSQRTRRSYEAATATLAAYSGLPGRNVMLLVAGQWPMDVDLYVLGPSLSEAGLSEIAGFRSLARRYTPERAREQLVAAANLAGFTLYPIDTAGRELDSRGASAAGLVEPGAGLDRENQLEMSLLETARETGGRALMDQQRDLALAEVVADVASYYSLGITLERDRDGEDHKVKVEMVERGLDARSRRGFTDFDRDEELTMAVEGALLFGEPTSRPLAVAASMPEEKGRRKIHLPLRLAIPLDEVAMLPRGGRYEARLELLVTARDSDGDRSDLPKVPVQFSGERAPAAGEVAYYDTVLELRNTEQRVVVALHDTVSEVSEGFLTAVLDVVPPDRRASR